MKGSLLLVDDEPGIRDSLGEYFLGEGYHVSLAASEEEAFQVYRAQRPGVVVSDLNLAPGSGIRLFQRLREHDAELPSPFCILMTGFGSMDNAIEALRGGADEYLTKPLQLKDLRKAVDAGFARSKARAQGDGSVSVERLVSELNAPLRRMRADLELLDLGRLGPLTADQGGKVQAVQASLQRLLTTLQAMQAQGGARDLDLFLEALEPEALLRQVQLGYLPDLERKGVSVLQSLPKGLPLVWTDRQHASAMIDLAFCSCLSLARPGSTISLDWEQSTPDPQLCFKVLDCAAHGGSAAAWPSAAELAPFNRANIAVEAHEQGCRIVLRFRGVRPS